MKGLGSLHQYVKDNYEKGNYQAASEAYKTWKMENSYSQERNNQAGSTDDYQAGFNQAKFDYENEHHFKRFPSKFIKLINLLSDDKASEVSKFIEGYNAYKEKH